MSTNTGVAVSSARTQGRTWGELLAGAFGAIYLLVGAIGFAVTGGVGFAETQGKSLLGIFELNPLHNLVHLAIGAALVAAFLGGRRAVAVVATTIGVVYLLVGIVGPLVTGTDANILALNTPDHLLHIGSAVVLIVAGMNARRTAR
jgi:hypothetical protein